MSGQPLRRRVKAAVRDIASNRITGPEAILVAAITWWISGRGGISKEVLAAARSADPEDVCTRADIQLGEAILRTDPASGLLPEFFRAAGSNPAIRHLMEQAAKSWRVKNGDGRVDAVRSYAARVLAEEAGGIVKESGILEERAVEIRAVRRRVGKRGGPARP